jgi:hypothetical protein
MNRMNYLHAANSGVADSVLVALLNIQQFGHLVWGCTRPRGDSAVVSDDHPYRELMSAGSDPADRCYSRTIHQG